MLVNFRRHLPPDFRLSFRNFNLGERKKNEDKFNQNELRSSFFSSSLSFNQIFALNPIISCENLIKDKEEEKNKELRSSF